MLIGDGGGYGGTDWMGMDVIQMWQAIENQDTTAHYQLLTGWRKSSELTLEHLAQVQNYRQSLAEAWPPETSAASAAYIERLDDMIANLQATYDAAVANHDAFANATLAISMSRDDVKKIYDEYTANQAKLEEFKNRPRPASKSPVPPPTPPVADGRQEELNNQARTIMFGLSGEVIQATSQIVKPTLYDPGRPRSDSRGEVSEDSTFVAPPVPPVTTYDPSSSAPGSGGSATQTAPTETTNPRTELNTHSKAGGQPGLVLGGAQPSSHAALAPMPGPGSLSPIGGGAIPNVPSPVPILSAPTGAGPRGISSEVRINKGVPPTAGVNGGFVSEGLVRSGLVGGMPQGEVRAMPPGAVIGGPPATGQNQSGTRGRAPLRVNPVGGVINSSNAEGMTGSVGRSATSAQPLGVVSGRADRRDTNEKNLHWDPDNPWDTEEGVSPILLPAQPQRVDPGPAIGLH